MTKFNRFMTFSLFTFCLSFPLKAIASPAAPIISGVAQDSQVTLNWNNVLGATAATSYTINYGTSSGVYSTKIAGIPACTIFNGTITFCPTLVTYSITGLTNGTTYFFTVTTVDNSGSAASNQISIIPQSAIPVAPNLNTATAGNARVVLRWAAVTGATSYSVKVGTATGVYGTPVVVGKVTSYTATGLTNGTTYYFVVTASNAGGTSPNSNQLSSTPQVAAPTEPTLKTATAGNTQVILGWSASTGATSYSVQYGTVSGIYQALTAGKVTSFTVTGLTNGTTYYFVVAAVNAGGTSTNSNVLSAMPIPSAITLTYTYDDLNRMLNEQRAPVSSAFNYDEVGNILSEATAALPNTSITLDSIAPGIPSGFKAVDVNSHQINLTWTASTDNVGVFGYVIYRNGFKVATTALTAFSDQDLVSGTMYSYTVRAIDASGNLSGVSTTATLTTP